VNPCGFPLLPAFLSYYVGAREERLPSAPNRIAQGIAGGLLVTIGFVGVFAVAALPVALGVGLVADAVPWTGMALGIALVALGALAVSGRAVRVYVRNPVTAASGSRGRALVLFGVGYGIASLGCTLPLFLAVVGAAVGAVGTVAVFAAYAAGTALMLVTFAVAAALLREGIGRALRRALPHMNRVGGALLCVAGAYLTYYWTRLEFGSSATLADDPIVSGVSRFTARVEVLASERGSLVLGTAAVIVAVALAVALWRWRRSDATLPVALVALVALNLAGCGGGGGAEPRETPDAQSGGLTDLGGIADLQRRFEADSGTPRLILLLSPT
jgi:cytochrome c-type biogenesis protein